VRGIDEDEVKNPVADGRLMGSDGYKSSFFKMGDDFIPFFILMIPCFACFFNMFL
jgi:hypothetical protein